MSGIENRMYEEVLAYVRSQTDEEKDIVFKEYKERDYSYRLTVIVKDGLGLCYIVDAHCLKDEGIIHLTRIYLNSKMLDVLRGLRL
jgi:C4-type Zn-finger protein